MALEIGELSQADINIKPPIILEKWRNRDQIVDEFKNTEVPILIPLKSVKVSVEKGSTVEEFDFDPLIQKDFNYYSRTRDLETNTPRTQLLQGIVDKMIIGTDINPRIVIMNKGKVSDGFTTPDGTIFISQSILNNLSSIDEVGAILAHEVGHLYLKTFERKVKAGNLVDQAGVSWIHEGVSDSVAKEFGEKAGLNTFAFGTAIEKISGASRGLEHQGGYMRSSQNVAEHSARHYETSAKAVEPIPIMLLRKVQPTNSEIIRERISKRLSGYMREDLSRLHPRDLEEAYKDSLEKVFDDGKYDYDKKLYLKSLQVLDNFNQLLNKRLLQAGFSNSQILTWLTTFPHYGVSEHSYPNRYLFKDLTDPVKVAQTIVEVSNTGEGETESRRRTDFFKKMSQSVFEEGPYVNQLQSFLSLLDKHLYDESSGSVKGEVPVNRDTILEILGKLSSLELDWSSEQYAIGLVLESYIEEAYYKNAVESGGEIDTDQITEFLDEAKEKGVKLDQSASQGILYRVRDRSYSIEKRFRSDSIEVQNHQKMVNTLKDYFGLKDWEPFSDINKEIDNFYQTFSNTSEKNNYYQWIDQISDFLFNLRKTFEHQDLSDVDREKFIQYLSNKFDNWSGFKTYSIRRTLEDTSFDGVEESHIDAEENAKLAQLKLKTVLGLVVFASDGEEFYRFLEDTVKKSGIDFSSFSKEGLVNIYSPLFLATKGQVTSYDGFYVNGKENPQMSVRTLAGHVEIKNFDKLTSLSLVSEIINRTEVEDLSSWDKLRISVATLARKLDINAYNACNFSDRQKLHFDIFSDNAITLLLFNNHRQAFLDLISNGVKEEDLGSLYETLVTIYPAEANRDNFLRAIQKRFLLSKNVSLDEKTNYLISNIESLGPDGAFMVADQITTLDDYQKFREKLGDRLEGYLDGGSPILKGLAADLVTSLLSGGFETVIQTTSEDPKTSRKASTDFVWSWFLHNFNLKDLEHIGHAKYDIQEKRFITGEKSRVTFRSVKDIFSLFKNFSHTQRFLTLHKALADVNGALSAPDHRKKLAGLVTEALKLKGGFVHDVLQAACLVGEPRLVSFPAANMLSPMLFRALDIDQVDLESVLKNSSSELDTKEGEPYKYLPLKDFLTPEDARKIVDSTTRQLKIFGAKFTHQPESYLYRSAQQSDLTYQQISDGLERQLLQEDNGQNEKGSEVDPNTEAVVKGVEASGALGVRSLQLASQLLKFSPQTERRLAHSFDANPGMKKLIFWERLYRQAQKDPQLLSFLNSTEIGDYLGGGSLFTTYAGIVKDAFTGQRREIVVKALNTNAEGFAEQYYSMATKVLSEVEKNRGNHGFARAARLLLDISQEWCKADIHDSNFAVDDTNFEKTIQSFNSIAGREFFMLLKENFPVLT